MPLGEMDEAGCLQQPEHGAFMQHESRDSRRWSGRAALLAILACIWCAAVVLPPVGFLRYRHTRLQELAAAGVQANWEKFRADMRSQSDRSGPVQRKVPRSPEPPELVWLRDYPALAVIAWVTFAGVLGGFLGLAVAGTLRPPPGRISGRESVGP